MCFKKNILHAVIYLRLVMMFFHNQFSQMISRTLVLGFIIIGTASYSICESSGKIAAGVVPAYGSPQEIETIDLIGKNPDNSQPSSNITTKEFILSTTWFVIAFMLIIYFLILKPHIDREQAQKKLVSELKKSDEVLTTGGIMGRVVSASPEFVLVEIAPGVKVKVDSRYVSKVPLHKEAGKDDKLVSNSKKESEKKK